jgi:hypothetical protein
MQCNGSGYCLTSGIRILCDFGCSLQECPNYVICQNSVPLFMLEFNGGVCTDCSIRFGRCPENPNTSQPVLDMIDNLQECPVCLQSSAIGVQNPRCNHYLCVSCIRTIYWYEDNLLAEFRPEFPHPSNIEEDYYNEPNLFVNDDLITKWKKALGSWNERRLKFVLENKKYLKHCPICRR